MANKINKEKRRSINATLKRSSNKNQWQGATEDTKQKLKRHLLCFCGKLFYIIFFFLPETYSELSMNCIYDSRVQMIALCWEIGSVTGTLTKPDYAVNNNPLTF
jgi:hypothetical protein